jgi:Cu(I)/Ag(I) efflux system membrane fusion protein
MKKSYAIILIIFMSIVGICSFYYFEHSANSQKADLGDPAKNKTYWTCAMHPQIHLNHSGKCPVCGMNLVKIKSQDTLTGEKILLDQGHQKIGNPINNLVGNPYWTCPMHPQIHSDHYGQCSICNMKLVLEKTYKPQKLPAETRSAITITNNQLELAGAQRQEVESMTLRVSIPVSGRFISSSKVAFQIYESDLRYIKTGLLFKGKSAFYPKKELSGVILSIDSIADPTSRTIRVVGEIKDQSSNILPETGFRGDIKFNLKNRLAIPESSVLHTGNGDLVYIFAANGRLTPKYVTLGLKSEGFYDVLDGLEVGQIITAGANFLIDSEAKIRGESNLDTTNHD